MKEIRTVIEWRSRSQWGYLPPSDLKWTEFCVVLERKQKPLKQGEKPPSATMVVQALNQEHRPPRFEYRLRP